MKKRKVEKKSFALDSVETALNEIKKGLPVIVVDDENRENEGDFIMAADKITPERVNFYAKEGRGLICMPVEKSIADRLDIPPMTLKNAESNRCNFTVSIDAKKGISTGISAKDRAKTILIAMNPGSKPNDLVRPGHIFPIRAAEGGVLVRAGHSEAAVDLAKLAGFQGGGVICEIIQDNGEMARLKHLIPFAKKHGLKIISIKALIHYRRQREQLVELQVKTDLKTKYGDFKIAVYKEKNTGLEHIALIHGKIHGKKNVLVRVHSECMTGDVFGSLQCDCNPQLEKALSIINKKMGSCFICDKKVAASGSSISSRPTIFKPNKDSTPWKPT